MMEIFLSYTYFAGKCPLTKGIPFQNLTEYNYNYAFGILKLSFLKDLMVINRFLSNYTYINSLALATI